MAEETTRIHRHHAEAKALHGELHLPLRQTIEPQALALLDPLGGYLSQNNAGFRAEGAVSYRSAYTQVAGNRDLKEGHGWSTVSTTVVEGLNILEIVTADRVVAQIFAEYPLRGYVPTISFVGTRFENLRIAGEIVDVQLDLNFFGGKPDEDLHYTRESGFMGRVQGQCRNICSFDALPAEARKRYEPYTGGAVIEKGAEIVECSLVNEIRGNFPGKSFAHAMEIPHFGTIYLATVKVTHDGFEHGVPHKTTVDLTMIDAQLGCIGHGNVSVGQGVTNGTTHP